MKKERGFEQEGEGDYIDHRLPFGWRGRGSKRSHAEGRTTSYQAVALFDRKVWRAGARTSKSQPLPTHPRGSPNEQCDVKTLVTRYDSQQQRASAGSNRGRTLVALGPCFRVDRWVLFELMGPFQVHATVSCHSKL
jgi:hypothetical protein